MNEIIDKVVGNNLVFGSLLVLLGIILIILIFSIVKSAKKSKKIPIYEEELENRELEKVKEKNIIDKPAPKKKKKKPSESKELSKSKLANVEKVEKIEKENQEEKLEPEETIIEKTEIEEKEETTSKQEQVPVNDYSEGEPEEIIDEGYSEERIAELESIDEDEIKERIDKEHEADIEETIDEIDNEEMVDILQNLKEAKEVKPEDVVRQFEQEQEAQSIISYQELVDVVKNRDREFEDELESKPLATVSDFLPEVPVEEETKDTDMTKLIEELGKPKEFEEKEEEEVEELESVSTSLEEQNDTFVDEETTNQIITEALKEIPEDGKFKKTELISPVFGRIESDVEDSYPTVKKFSREADEKEEELIEEIKLPEVQKDDTISTEAAEIESFEDISEELEEDSAEVLFEEIPNEVKLEKTSDLGMGDISKNEEFLKALKDFRDSL